jgi:glycosyltransferase involved in cell wall biosynthesis
VTSIAIVTQGFALGGGVPTAVRWLADHLAAEGFAVTIVDLAMSSRDDLSRSVRRPSSLLRSSLREGPDDAGVERWGANVPELEPMRYLPRRELTAFLDRFDLVHVLAGGPALGNVARRVHRPVVLQMATAMQWERERKMTSGPPLRQWYTRSMTRLVTALEARALRSADSVLVMNDVMGRHAEAITGHEVVKAAPGIDTDRFRPLPSGWDPHGPMLSVCRLADPRKGLHRLLEAYRIAVHDRPDLPDLCLAGMGPVPAALSAQVEGSGLTGRVEFRTDVPPDDLPALYRQASVYLQASYEEGLGISVLEAAGSGLPVVATTTSGTLETVLPGRTGFLVEQGPDSVVATAMAAKILVIPQQGDAMAAAARLHCENDYSSRVMLGRHLHAYSQLLGTERPQDSSP